VVATVAGQNGQAAAASTRASNSEVVIGRAHLIKKHRWRRRFVHWTRSWIPVT